MRCLVAVDENRVDPPPPPPDPILEQPIDAMDLPVRTANGLRALGIHVLADLLRLTGAELLRAPYLGRRSLREIEDALRSRGLMLAGDLKNWPPAAGGRLR